MALKDLVRKFREAVAGSEAPGEPARPFDWEPAPLQIPATGPAADSAPAPLPAGTPATPAWKRRTEEAPSPASGPIPADVADFATVYKAAGVQAPGHGYGVDRVAQMLGHKSLAGLDRSVKASAVLAALDAADVALADVVQDATLRFKSLVAFEAAKDLELQATRPRNERRIERLKADSEAFEARKKAEIDALARETSEAANGIARLRQRKRAEEERLHKAVAMFVEPLPARVIPMPAKPAEEAKPEPKAEAPKPELKLVTPAAPGPGDTQKAEPRAAASDATIAMKPEEHAAADAKAAEAGAAAETKPATPPEGAGEEKKG